ncbi:hypothetical protein EV2_020115 [Malus domestica]
MVTSVLESKRAYEKHLGKHQNLVSFQIELQCCLIKAEFLCKIITSMQKKASLEGSCTGHAISLPAGGCKGNRVIFLVKEGSSIFMPPGIGTHSADQKLRRLWPRTSKVVDRSARAPLLGIKVPSDLSFNASLQHFFSTLHCCLAALV